MVSVLREAAPHPVALQPLYLTDLDLEQKVITEATKRLEELCSVYAARRQRASWAYDDKAHYAALEALRRERRNARFLDGEAA